MIFSFNDFKYLCGVNWKETISSIAYLEIPVERLELKQKQLAALRPLPASAVKKLRDTLAIEWTYHSNAIEGNTLSLIETLVVIEDGITIKGKTLREHLEAVNHYEAIDEVVKLAQPDVVISEKMILDLHALVLQRIEKDFAGRYRNIGVRIVGANFIPPNYAKVPDLMEELMSWVYENPDNLPPILLAAAFHHRFVWIHPFADGNGRTARLLHNLYLMSKGYPPAIILKQDRQKYYRALNEANQGKYQALGLLMLQAAERTLDIYLGTFEGNLDDFKPITDLVEEEDLPYGEEYISLLARKGKIDSYKEGKSWYTSLQAIEAYRETRKRKR